VSIFLDINRYVKIVRQWKQLALAMFIIVGKKLILFNFWAKFCSVQFQWSNLGLSYTEGLEEWM